MAGQTNDTPGDEKPRPPFKYWFWANIFELARLYGKHIIVGGVICYCVYQISFAARSFAGQNSTAHFVLLLFANVLVHWTLTVSVSGISLALYLRERNQHHKTRERLARRVKELELLLDPKRSSSHLTTKGLTRKGDE